MPATRNADEENPIQESVQQTTLEDNSYSIEGSHDTGQTMDNTGAEVSSTTVDLDTVHGQQSGPVQSTSIDASVDSLDDFKEQTAAFDESPSKPSSSTGSGTLGRGFQDAFAAFASSSFRDPEEESPMDTGNEVCDVTAGSGQEATTSSVSHSTSLSTVESTVSSAIDSGQVTTTGEPFTRLAADVESMASVTTETSENESQQVETYPGTDAYPQQAEEDTAGVVEQGDVTEQIVQPNYGESQQAEAAAASSNDSVYFIQMTDATGQVVTSIIDPNDIPSYTDSVVYKQCMRADGEIETTIVYSGGVPVTQEEQQIQEQATTGSEEAEFQQGEQQIIYAHDLNGHLTPIDSAQSINDVAPPGKQFVYMQDSTGRIIRTIMDANQTMVPGQQVYYTQSEDGRIITSVMDSASAEEASQVQQPQEAVDQIYQQRADEADVSSQQQEASTTSVVGGTSGFNIDNSMSGLSMLAELSHLTAGQTSTAPGLATEHRSTSSTDSSSMDLDEFRPVAMVTRQVAGEEGLESEIAGLKVGEADSDSLDQSSLLQGDGTGQEETLITKIVSQLKGDDAQLSTTVSRDNLFVQWQNLDAMCWMDVVLIMLVNSPTLRPLIRLDSATGELASTLLITLLKANRQAQVLLQNLLKKSNGAEISSLQTGAGNTVSIQDPKTSKLVCKENMDEIGKAINILYAMREKIWQALQPRLRCERGKHNSPVLVLPLIVREKPAIKQMFTMSYRYVFKCEKCGYSQDDNHTKILPSIPAVPEDFNMKTPCFVRNCFECQAPNQRMLMKFEMLHDFVQMHFVKGLPHNRFEDLSFDFNDDHYEVTAVVHYKNNPDHFIAWVRNAPGPAWMECDDLKSVLTCYLNVSPNIPPSQVHMVMWERRLIPQHTLVMRDTEDTRLLASLVLTVQQPNAHRPADPAPARPTGIPSTTTVATPNPATTSQVQTTSVSALTTQTFTPYNPRQKGRGRGRGAYGSRGQVTAAITPVIRRVSPAITQVQAQTTPQIVRLPLAALTSPGLNLRGSSPGATRYVLLGGNTQAGSTAPNRAATPSKVVVVRQGGANISATQLLQLLQRSGAINQPGARITTTVTTSGANTDSSPATASTSYIIQQDGTIITAPAEAAAHRTPGQSVIGTPALDSTTEQSVDLSESLENQQSEQISASSMVGQNISTLPYSGNMTSDSANDSILQPVESGTSVTLGSPVETWASTSEADVPRDVGSQAASLIQQSQQPVRYIRVPNPAGGTMLLKQLGVKDGKMVLVPVDKNLQAQSSGVSAKLTINTPTSSPKSAVRVPTTTSQAVSPTSAGSVLAQIQQYLQTQNTSSSPVTGRRVITIPGPPGSQRVQVITVPRGMSATQTNQSSSKTIFMHSVGSQQTAANTITRLTTPREAINTNVLSQSGSILTLRQSEGDSAGTASSLVDSLSPNASTGHTVSTSTVSLFRDVMRPTTSSVGTSLLSSPTQQQKPPENFRYILPGSNTTHILHTGTSGLQTGRTFTALSSSGTIIGGQLTPSASGTAETSPLDKELAFSNTDDVSSQETSLPTPRRQLSREFDMTEYIPLGRARARGGQRGGRGRGGRTPRGRGRSQLWSPDAELIAPAPASSTRKISTLSELRQIGAHIIETGSETVDGVPVVSIPDFSSEGATQTEILPTAPSVISEAAAGTVGQGIAGLSGSPSQLVIPDDEQGNLSVSDNVHLSQGPRVITQSIPSVKANHGFDILTQGILGASDTARPATVRHARSLLTGATTMLHTPSSLLTTLAETAALSPGREPVSQPEIDALIQAAQAAAQHQKAVPQAAVESNLRESESHIEAGVEISDLARSGGVDSNNSLDSELIQSMPIQQEQSVEPEGPVVSVDESQVSAAERYRMPMELFQPDEESPEKSSKSDDTTNRLAVDLPSKLFQEPEISSHVDMPTKSPRSRGRKRATAKGSGRRKSASHKMQVDVESSNENVEADINETVMETEESSAVVENAPTIETSISGESVPQTDTEDSVKVALELNTTSTEDATEVCVDKTLTDNLVSDQMLEMAEEAEQEKDVPVKKVGRSRGRPPGPSKKRGGRRKSRNVHSSEILQIPHSSDVAFTRETLDVAASAIVAVDSADSAKEIVDGVDTATENVDFTAPPKEARDIISPSKEAEDIIAPSGKEVDDIVPDSLSEMLCPEPEISKPSPKILPEKCSDPDLVQANAQATDSLTEKSDDEMMQETAETSSNVDAGHKELVRSPIAKTEPVYKAREEKRVTKSVVYSPAIVRYKKEEVSWDVDTMSTDTAKQRHCFNYKVLRGKFINSHPRHPLLGPLCESFTSAPSPLPALRSKTNDSPMQSLPAVVIHRNLRPLHKPNTDPATEPVVIPLENTGDPASTGGSVISSPSIGKIFTGVVLKRRQKIVDWRMLGDEEDVELTDNLGEEVEQIDKREYCKQLMTELFIYAGGFSSVDSDDVHTENHLVDEDMNAKADEQSKKLELCVSDKTEEVTDVKSGELDGADILVHSSETETCQPIRKKGKQNKRKQDPESPLSSLPAKQAKSSQDEESDNCMQSPPHSEDSTFAASTPSRVNGIDTITAATPLSQTSDPEPTQGQQKDKAVAASSQLSFPSPSRRSGRIPVPSKKVLDAWEEFPARSALKGRRASSISSDDELSGYSSGDTHHKKQKSKQAFPLS